MIMRLGGVLGLAGLLGARPALGGTGIIWTGKEPNGVGWVNVQDEPGPHKPYPPITNSWNKTDTSLWIGIASFRDPYVAGMGGRGGA